MAEKETLTPMMRQYMDIKEKHQDMVLFFRLGDFYEMFGEDAKTAALSVIRRRRGKTIH